jgi:hypothetical protein
MKKLLALILCVMMFVSVLSTSAFAITTDDQRLWRDNSKIVDALKTNINNMYGSLAADTAVYQSVKSIDSMMKDLVDEMIKGYAITPAGTQQAGSVIKDAVLAGLRATIGGEISNYLEKHNSEYYTYDSLGHRVFDAAKYAGTFAKAATNAVSSEKAVKGIQAYMYYILQRSTYNQAAQDLAELRQDMASWGNWGKYGFDDLTKAAGAMHMPGTDIDNSVYNADGTMHGVNAIYDEYLTEKGMLGVDLDGDGFWDTGIAGITADIVSGAVPTLGTGWDKGTENEETPIWNNDLPWMQ